MVNNKEILQLQPSFNCDTAKKELWKPNKWSSFEDATSRQINGRYSCYNTPNHFHNQRICTLNSSFFEHVHDVESQQQTMWRSEADLLNDDRLRDNVNTIPNSNHYTLSNHHNHFKDVESAESSTNPEADASNNEYRVETVCETVSSLPRSSLKIFADEKSTKKLQKETTFFARPTLNNYHKPNFVPGRPIQVTTTKSLPTKRQSTTSLSFINHSTPRIKHVMSDPISFESNYDLIPEDWNKTLHGTCNEQLNTICGEEPFLNIPNFAQHSFSPNASEKDTNYLPNGNCRQSPSFPAVAKRETNFTGFNNIKLHRFHSKKLTRHSRTRRAQRRKRISRVVIHSKARRNSALLAKNLPYKPKATRYNEEIPDNFYSALITMIFCCLPLGIASLIYTFKVRFYMKNSNREMAQESSLLGRKLANTGKMMGITSLAYVVVYFVVKSNMPNSPAYDYYLPDYNAG